MRSIMIYFTHDFVFQGICNIEDFNFKENVDFLLDVRTAIKHVLKDSVSYR